MNIELRQWYYGDEEALINLYDNYDRSCCNLDFPEPGKCSKDDAIWHIRRYVDIGFDGYGYARAIVLDCKVVGHIQYTMHPDIYDANCDLKIILLPEACGRGVGCYAVRKMIEHAFYASNYEGVFLTMLEDNVAARRMAEKAGMKYCGIDSSGDWTFHGEPCNMVVYGIRRPRKETVNSGVELKPWERRDIDDLAHLYETVDKRFDDFTHPIIRCGRARNMEEIEQMDSKMKLTQMLYSMREIIDEFVCDERRGGDIYRAIVNDGEIVGLVSVRTQYGKQAHDGLLGYMMMSEHCGKGIATKAVRLMLEEAFRLRDLHRVSAWVYKPNIASSRVLEKNGFRLEGVKEDGVMCEGVPTDYLMYGLLKSRISGFVLNNDIN